MNEWHSTRTQTNSLRYTTKPGRYRMSGKLEALASTIGSWNGLRTRLILCRSIAGVRLFRLRFNFLIANVEYRALLVLVDYFKPAARFGIVEKVVVRIVGE